MNNELKQEDFDQLKEKLKEYDNAWATVLAGRIAAQADESTESTVKRYRDMNRKKVYNIFEFVIKDKATRLHIYEQGLAYLSELTDKNAKLAQSPTPES